MSEQTAKAIKLLEMLPEEEQRFAFEIIKKLVLAWDPDYTKLTILEQKSLDEAMSDNTNISHDELMKELGIIR